MAYGNPAGVNKILVETHDYEWVNGKAWAPGTAPEPFIEKNFEVLATSERLTINFESASGFYNTHRQLFVQDLNGDGISEVMLHFSAYPEFQEIPVVVMSKTSAGLQNISASIFDIVPKTQHNHQSQYIDLDLDGDNDLLIGDAGFDLPPWTGGGFDIYLQEEGLYEKLSIPEDLATVRTYAISGGDLDGDYRSEIVLTDSNEVLGLGKGPILKFSKHNDDYDFSISKTTLPNFWQYGHSSDLQILDIDQNGSLDLFIGNNWASPNYTIFFDGLDASEASRLPENHWGHTTFNSALTQETSVGASLDANLFIDFDQDGDLDLFSIAEEVILTGNGENVLADYQSGRGALQIYEQTSPKSFERTNQSDFDLYLGNKFYFSIQAQDFNSDDKVDVIAHYNSKENGDAGRAFNAGSTIFLNKGDLQFEAFDSVDFIGAFDGTNGLDQYGFFVPLTDTKNSVTDAMLLVPMLAGFHETTDMHLEVQEVELKFLETEAEYSLADGTSVTLQDNTENPTISHTVTTSVVTRDGSKIADADVVMSDGTNSSSYKSAADGSVSGTLTSGSASTIEASLAYSSSTKAISSQDALDTLKLSVGMTTAVGTNTAFDYMAADFNQDGKVSSQDALSILKYSVGLTTPEQAKWVFVDTNGDYSGVSKSNTSYTEGVSIANLTADTSVSLTGILIGDVNDSYSGLIA